MGDRIAHGLHELLSILLVGEKLKGHGSYIIEAFSSGRNGLL